MSKNRNTRYLSCFLFLLVFFSLGCKENTGTLPKEAYKGDLAGALNRFLRPPRNDYCHECSEHKDSEKPGPQRIAASDLDLFKNFKKLGGDTIAFQQAMCFLKKHEDTKFKSYGEGYKKGIKIENQRFVTIQDLNKSSNEKRLFILDRETGKVEAYHSGHGIGRSPERNDRGVAKYFGNTNNSLKTPTGFFVTGNRYNSTKSWRVGMRLHGLQQGINHNSMKRGIVFHGSSYTPQGAASSDDEPPVLNGVASGRSHGCTTVHPSYATSLMSKLESGREGRHPYKGGALYYNFGPDEKSKGTDYCGHSLVPEVK